MTSCSVFSHYCRSLPLPQWPLYKRGCQEHCSPTAGCAGLFRGIQPLSPEKTLVWCRALGCSISTAASFLVAIYKRGCQEHCSPTAGCAGLFRGIQPLSPEKTLVWCRALGCSISTAASFLVATTPISFETYQAVRLYGVNHGSI